MANKKQEEFKELIKEKKEQIQNKTSTWTDEELMAHMDKATRVYLDSKTPNKLGNFSFDKENVYFWHVYTDNDTTKLSKRLALGWSFAPREDAIRAGLTASSLSDQTVDGETCVEMSHKSSKAVLLKIPKQLHDLNRLARERIQKNRPMVDADGNIVDRVEIESHDSVTRRQKDPLITL